ncbi:MAG: phosphatidylserine decarboxylase family protein [Prevotellaceae bacterium]|jgi:phosphatidylserine decarboxylase|nr:phosphatidylserine decarboxylase family protein [Prevotellaceae bacterium]
MSIHREGTATIIVVFVLLATVCTLVFYFFGYHNIFTGLFLLAALIFYGVILRFFRVPAREKHTQEGAVFSPCDGKVVVVEEVYEPEFLKEKCMQLSVFMSPNNVHVNWYPVSGTVEYSKHHHGKYLVAWHPKSSTENERTTVVVNTGKARILFRQIAGAVARRIVCYAKKGNKAEQNTELGFIKFGSRVDVFLPLSAKINVRLGQNAVGSQTILAEL